jgi:hypothetical protein
MKYSKSLIIILSACAVLVINFLLLKNTSTRRYTGFFDDSDDVTQNVKNTENESHLTNGGNSSHADENNNL